MENRVMFELQQLLESLPSEKQHRILYALDYVGNYFVGDEKSPSCLNKDSKRVTTVMDIGVIFKTNNNWRGYEYERLYLNQDIGNSIEKLLHEKYYSSFSPEEVTRNPRNS